MKKFFCICLTLVFLSALFTIYNNVAFADNDAKSEIPKGAWQKSQENGEKYDLKSENILVCDALSSFPVYSKNSDVTINPSGFTKILTAITVIENTPDIDAEITVPKYILKSYDYKFGNIGLTSGEKISVRTLLTAMMMHDAGDCAIALAHVTSKDYNSFIKLLNDTAMKAGAMDSVFKEPAGFGKDGQKSTLNDIAKITSYALKNETFCEIAKCDYLKIEPTNKCEKPRVLFSKNKFLTKYYSQMYYNPNIYGVKTYHNSESDKGLVARYSVGDDDFLILTAKSFEDDKADYAYDDTLYLINKFKGYFTKVNLVEKETFVSEIKLKNAKDATRLLVVSLDDVAVKIPKDYKKELITKDIKLRDKIDAPLEKYEDLGTLNVYYDKIHVGTARVAANNEVRLSILKYLKNKLIDFIFSIYFPILVVIVLIVRYILKQKNKRKNKKKLKIVK